jgi:hypothetical protein
MVHSNHIRSVIVCMINILNFRAIRISRRRSRVKCLTHTHLKVVLERANLEYSGETERLNGPKSVVSPFDDIRCIGKASRVES